MSELREHAPQYFGSALGAGENQEVESHVLKKLHVVLAKFLAHG
jgi:hypothetical protein